MTTENTISTETSATAENTFAGSATYSPEDNKLRLYVGRVPRDEYLKLRAAGWQCLHKQRESGGGDFAAVWSPSRRETALAYAGIIEDEDKGPAERAAERAERFGGYRDKRTGDATGHADKFDAGPAAHGYQSQARAERAAARHDRQADRAGDAWGKAEYWQRRTAGVISNALYKSTPAVRMGRIKILEADLRRFEQSPASYSNWIEHTKLRLDYENQMCEAAGGRAALVEMIPGGFIGSHQIRKVNKSPVTGLVVSVEVMGTHSGYTRESNYREYKTQACPVLLNIERLKADAYRPATDEELTAFLAAKKAEKAAKPKVIKTPLINPKDADAEKLQAVWNAKTRADFEARIFGEYGRGKNWVDYIEKNFKPSTVCRIKQAVYSAASGGNHARAEIRAMAPGGVLQSNSYNAKKIDAVCQLRTTWGDGEANGYPARRVILLTDKPQKPLPTAVWGPLVPAMEEKPPAVKFWNCNCGFQDQTSAVYDAKICPKCGTKMHDDTAEVLKDQQTA